MKIINLTQHKATPEQILDGVFEPTVEQKQSISDLLTFNSIPTVGDIKHRADVLARTARLLGADAAMIGGAPYLMSALEIHLKTNGVVPMYAFSERVSVETANADGSITKTNVFKHIGFISV